MKCILQGQNATVLARSIQSFSRIGSELYLTATSEGLSLRTMNPSKSGYAMILFYPDFFLDYNVQQNDDPLENQCKLSMKSCLGVFRSMKQVESCAITLNVKSAKLIVQYKCRAETVKTHHISILEHESLAAAYVTDNAPNVLSATNKIFSDIVTNFKINEEELTIMVNDKKVVAKNYVENSPVDIRFVRSQLSLKPEEFEGYTVSKETTITFCMRELRAILSFAEALNTSISMNFDAAGKPVVFIIKNFDMFEANLVMSTLVQDDDQTDCQRSQSAANGQNVLQKSQANDSSVQISDTETNADVAGLTIKRNRISSQKNVPENTVIDIARKKRKTIDNELTPSLDSLQIRPIENVRNALVPPQSTQSEEVAVIFQDESESISLLNQDSEMREGQIVDDVANLGGEPAVKKPRDHRPFIRQVFDVCFSSGTEATENNGIVMAECSDEE